MIWIGQREHIFYSMGGEAGSNRVPREVVDPLPLEVFKARMDEALSNMVYWKVFLPTAEGLN